LNKDYTVQLEAPPAIIEKDSTRSDAVRQRLQQIDSTVTLNYFEQIDLLAEVNHNNYWDAWKFPSMKEFVKKSGFDLTMAEVDKGIQISTVSKVLEIGKVSLAKAKKTKVNIIFQLDHTKTVTDPATQTEEKISDVIVQLVNDAPSKTVVELKEIVKRLKALYSTDDEKDSELTWLNLPVRRDAKQIVLDAINLAQKLAGQTIDTMTKESKDLSLAAAFELVAASFIADPNNVIDEDGKEGTFEDSVDENEPYDDSIDGDADANGAEDWDEDQ
jgi:hypothetical protein